MSYLQWNFFRKMYNFIYFIVGATEIVVGFGFHTAIPEENFSTVNTFHTIKNRELTIVFVKMDTYTGTQLSTDVDKKTLFHLQNVLMK